MTMKSKSGDNLSISNEISRELQNALYQKRLQGPSVVQRYQWHQEWLKSGAQYRMSYREFEKSKIKSPEYVRNKIQQLRKLRK
jgi:hypothetical protein